MIYGKRTKVSLIELKSIKKTGAYFLENILSYLDFCA